ncbi:MAG TPA: 50S ribosomal protein L15 [Candidatus Limnocylindrales bacterium]|nr:50S ribosomal protein L15 [Candidatus Limnocylindrales bacterium]
MKLHDLRPAEGAHRPRKRVGRGIAAGGGKTAGRGTKGQKARAGGSIPPWFEGGQTPLHMRIPKLRGFKNRFKIDYEVVNVGAIAQLVEAGAFEPGDPPGTKSRGKPAPITVNQEILRATGLVRTLDKPLKILGAGELSTSLFVVADAFSRTAVAKIEAAGGSVTVLEVPGRRTPALTVPSPEAAETPEAAEPPEVAEAPEAPEAVAEAPEASEAVAEASDAVAESADEAPAADAVADEPKKPRRARAAKPADAGAADAADADATPDAD